MDRADKDYRSARLHPELGTKRCSKKKKSKKEKNTVVKRGRWEVGEKKAFLRGLLTYGRGKWKAISKLIPQR